MKQFYGFGKKYVAEYSEQTGNRVFLLLKARKKKKVCLSILLPS